MTYLRDATADAGPLASLQSRLQDRWGDLFRPAHNVRSIGGATCVGECWIGQWLRVWVATNGVVFHDMAEWMDDDPDWMEGTVGTLAAAVPASPQLPENLAELTWQQLLAAIEEAGDELPQPLVVELDRRVHAPDVA